MSGTLTDVAGLQVGRWTDLEAATGCTVALFDLPARLPDAAPAAAGAAS